MAGDWIKVEKVTPRKREVLIIAGKLKIHPDHAFGLCFRFWSWCDDNLSDRYASGVTEALLDQLLGYDGFATAAVDVGWLLSRNGSIEVPNFDRHLSQSAKKRALSKDRNKSKRKRDASSVTEASPEKRREEKSIKERERGGAVIPESLDTKEFVKVWGQWRAWCLSVSGKPFNEIQGELQLQDLVKRGHDKAIDDLKLTMQMSQRLGRIWDSDKEKPKSPEASQPLAAIAKGERW